MPEVALLVGERGVDGRVVQEHDLLARVALVILQHCVGDGERDRAAVALHDVARAVVERALQLDQRFLRVHLVVERQQLQLLAVETARRIDRVDVELVRLLRQNAGVCGAAGERIDKGDLDLGGCRRGDKQSGERPCHVAMRAFAHISS